MTRLYSVGKPIVDKPLPKLPPNTLQLFLQAMLWAGKWAGLVFGAILIVNAVGFMLGWTSDQSPKNVELAAKVFLVVFLLLTPPLFALLLNRSPGDDDRGSSPVTQQLLTAILRSLIWSGGSMIAAAFLMLAAYLLRFLGLSEASFLLLVLGGVLAAAAVGLVAFCIAVLVLFAPLGLIFWIYAIILQTALFLLGPLEAPPTPVGACSWLIGSVVLFIPVRIIALSRSLQDLLFKGVGFGATFFGMAMLVLFLSQLAAEVYDWTRYMPQVIARRNQETLKAREELKNFDKLIKDKKEEIARTMKLELAIAASEEERQFVIDTYNDRTLVFPIDKKGNIVPDPKSKLYTIEPIAAGYNIVDAIGRLLLTIKGKEVVLVSSAITNGNIVRDKNGVIYQFEDGFPVKDKDGKQVPLKTEKGKQAAELKVVILGATSESIANEKLTILEKKVIADLPLREATVLGALGHFLTHGPSDSPENAGIFTALLGSLFLAFITIVIAVPIGVGAALYLEEYRTAGRLSRIIQININNLAGVPSVVYGILGGAVFVQMFSNIENNQARILRELAENPDVVLGFWDRVVALLPAIASRNVLGGGLTLALLTLPVVIVASQEAIRAVPQSIRHGAYALGATQWQTIWSNVLPMARPGILTGTILSLSRAIGEAAPLILFGALIFVDQNPSLFSRFTILPMQIFGWVERPADVIDGQRLDLWRYNAAVAIVVLLVVLLAMNAVAIVLRNRAQKQMRY